MRGSSRLPSVEAVDDGAVRQAQSKAGQRGVGDRLAGTQAVEVQVLDDARVGQRAQVDDDLVAVLVGVDVVEGKARVGLEAVDCLAGGAVDQREARAELGLPPVVLDVRASGQRERQRVDDERELGEHDPAFGQAERVHVGGLLDRQRGDHAGLELLRVHREEPVAAARAEVGGVVERRPLARSRCGCAVVSCPGALYGCTSAAFRVRGSNWTCIGVSVIATKRSPSFITLTLALSGKTSSTRGRKGSGRA